MFCGFVNLEASLVGSLLCLNTSDTPINADALPTFRCYGPNGVTVTGACTFRDSGSITGATNASPIVITSASHGLSTGVVLTISGVGGNTAANGTFVITKVDANTFSLNSSTGNGAYTSGGTWNVTGLYEYEIAAAGADGFEVTENYQILFSYQISTTNKGQVHSFCVT